MLKERFAVKPLLMLLSLGLLLSCLDPYNLPVVSSGADLLVVDGKIINGDTSTIFRLFRSRSVYNDTTLMKESKATVRIETDTKDFFNLVEQEEGTYLVKLDNLDADKKYRLYIKTSNGKEYYSEWVELKKTPEIDSITWEKKPDGVQIYTNTHDPEGKAKYYQYEYEEAWKFRSFDRSDFMLVNNIMVERPKEMQIYECFNYESSSIISLATSKNLTEDIIYKNPLLFISASTTNKLSVRYTILVRQFAISEEAFDYWQKLKKVTEDIGSLFDPQPSTFKGNIYCVSDENELVLGFVSASNFTEKRIFIDRREYGWESPVFTGYEGCWLDSIPGHPLYPRKLNPDHIIAFVSANVHGAQLLTGKPECMDCTLRGTLEPPPYWK